MALPSTVIVIDASASVEALRRAASLLEDGSGTVKLQGVCTLRSVSGRITCEVPDPLADQHRCAEELTVLLENGRRALADSALAAHLPDRPLEWRVVAT